MTAAFINDSKATMRTIPRISRYYNSWVRITLSAQDGNRKLQFPGENCINTRIGYVTKPLSKTNPQLSDSPNPKELV